MEIKVSFPEGQKTKAEFKEFTVLTDQSIAKGGTNLAPTPFDLFLTSIATCVGVTVNSFFKARNIDNQDLSIKLTADQRNQEGMIENIELQLNLSAEFPEKYKQALLKAVNSCTVKKHLLNPPQFSVELVEKL